MLFWNVAYFMYEHWIVSGRRGYIINEFAYGESFWEYIPCTRTLEHTKHVQWPKSKQSFVKFFVQMLSSKIWTFVENRTPKIVNYFILDMSKLLKFTIFQVPKVRFWPKLHLKMVQNIFLKKGLFIIGSLYVECEKEKRHKINWTVVIHGCSSCIFESFWWKKITDKYHFSLGFSSLVLFWTWNIALLHFGAKLSFLLCWRW